MRNAIAIGADIGGSHIFSAAIDLSNHQLIGGTVSEQKIDNKGSSEEILTGWSTALDKTISMIDRGRLAGIGFAMPGPFDYPNGIALFKRVEKYESLYGVDVSSEIRRRLRLSAGVPIRYINDATSFAIAEAWIGKASQSERVIALTLGTGFGSAFLLKGVPVIDGDTVPGSGCVWHLPFREGIADDYFSTRWFIRRYKEKSGQTVAGVKDIADDVAVNPVAKSLFEEYGISMGSFLSPWIEKFGAEVLVIGGNIANSFHLFGEQLKSGLSGKNITIEIHLSELKENAAVIGGARLIDEDYWVKVKDLLSKM
jgi:glucokinase